MLAGPFRDSMDGSPPLRQGQVAVVTGAASGIGLALVEEMLSDGAAVVMADLDGQRLHVEADRLKDLGTAVIPVTTDVGSSDDVFALAQTTIKEFGRVDILCNIAGTLAMGPAWAISLDEWERVIRVNLFSVVHGIRAFVPLLRAHGDRGYIVNTASTAAFQTIESISPYTASKHAVVGLSEVLLADLQAAGSGIGVSVLCPGMVATRFAQPDAEVPDESELPAGVISAREVAGEVCRAMLEHRFYVFTHDDTEAVLLDRQQRLLSNFAAR